jgi:hypothetical protein
MFEPLRVAKRRQPFIVNFMLLVPEASLPAVLQVFGHNTKIMQESSRNSTLLQNGRKLDNIS